MSNKDTEQKYFVGNWIQHKTHPEWVAFINDVFNNLFGKLTIRKAILGEVESYNLMMKKQEIYIS